MPLQVIRPSDFEKNFSSLMEAGHVFLMEGEEAFLRRDAADRIAASCRQKDYEVRHVPMDRIALQQALHDITTPGLFGETRCLVVSTDAAADKDALAILDAVARRVAPTHMLVVNVAKIDKRGRSKHWHGIHVHFRKVYADKLPGWARQRARRYGIHLDGKAALLLGYLADGDLSRVDGELEKLGLYLGGGGTATERDICSLCGNGQIRNVFALGEAILDGNPGEAVRIRRLLLQHGTPTAYLNILQANQLHRILGAKEWMTAGKRGDELAAALHMHPFFVKRLARQASRISLDKLRTCYRMLLEDEVVLKSQSHLTDAHGEMTTAGMGM